VERMMQRKTEVNKTLWIGELKKLAKKSREMQYANLMEKREKNGHVIYVPDFGKNKVHGQEEVIGKGWRYQKGTFTIDYPYQAEALKEAQKFADQLAEKIGLAWYKPFDPTKTCDVWYGGLYFKTLGDTVNHAVDPVFFLPDGKIFRVVRDFDVPPTSALPGGVVEDNVLNTCVNESIEELLGGDIFAEGSETASSINGMNGIKEVLEEVLVEKLTELLNIKKDDMDNLKSVRESISEFMWTGWDICEANDINIRAIIKNIRENGIDESYPVGTDSEDLKRIQFIVAVKTGLYKKMFPAQIKALTDYIKAEAVTGERVINSSDPRNTDASAMYTQTKNIVCPNAELLHKITIVFIKRRRVIS
jgi:hypothetical protein